MSGLHHLAVPWRPQVCFLGLHHGWGFLAEGIHELGNLNVLVARFNSGLGIVVAGGLVVERLVLLGVGHVERQGKVPLHEHLCGLWWCGGSLGLWVVLCELLLWLMWGNSVGLGLGLGVALCKLWLWWWRKWCVGSLGLWVVVLGLWRRWQ